MTEFFRRQVGDEVTYLAHLDNPPRKLKAVWTVEAEQDLQNWFNTPIAQQFVEELAADLRRHLGLEETNFQQVNWKKEGF